MDINKNIILELKEAILKSRYQAARLVNKELIVLYFSIGKKISETATKEVWGSKILEQISKELQNELPGLRGFSSGNLKKFAATTTETHRYVIVTYEEEKIINDSDVKIEVVPLMKFLLKC